MQAINSTRAGAHVGYVGVSHDVSLLGILHDLWGRRPMRSVRSYTPVSDRGIRRSGGWELRTVVGWEGCPLS
jgi:hypothetical protein